MFAVDVSRIININATNHTKKLCCFLLDRKTTLTVRARACSPLSNICESEVSDKPEKPDEEHPVRGVGEVRREKENPMREYDF